MSHTKASSRLWYFDLHLQFKSFLFSKSLSPRPAMFEYGHIVDGYCNIMTRMSFLTPFRYFCSKHYMLYKGLYYFDFLESFQCPDYYFKCPNSFCVEKLHVCDGGVHCKNGEDELYCGRCIFCL